VHDDASAGCPAALPQAESFRGRGGGEREVSLGQRTTAAVYGEILLGTLRCRDHPRSLSDDLVGVLTPRASGLLPRGKRLAI
jgi:hypothetical protein